MLIPTRFPYRIGGAALILALAVLATGCPRAPVKDAGTDTKKDGDGKKGPTHPDQGPHDGFLAEWGEEDYHAEVTFDHPKKRTVVYILGSDAKKPSPIDADEITLTLNNVKPPVQLKLKADPQEGDPKGQASRFTGEDEALEKKRLRGEVSGVAFKKPYSGTFDEHEHKHK